MRPCRPLLLLPGVAHLCPVFSISENFRTDHTNFGLEVEAEFGRFWAHSTLEIVLCAMDRRFPGRVRDFRANLAYISRVLLPWSVAQIFSVLRLRVSSGRLSKCQPEYVNAFESGKRHNLGAHTNKKFQLHNKFSEDFSFLS